jgi:hypothetical protein
LLVAFHAQLKAVQVKEMPTNTDVVRRVESNASLRRATPSAPPGISAAGAG